MQTQEAFTIKNYTDREGLETSNNHSSQFIHLSANSIKTIVASKSQDKVFSLRILETKENNIFEMSIPALRACLEQLEFDKQEYQSTKIVVENNGHALVPEALFAGEKAASFLKLNTPLEKQHVMFNRLSKNMVSVFAINEQFYQVIKSIFPHSELIHNTQIFLNLLFAVNTKDVLYVNIHDEYIEVAQMKNNELHYLNSFRVEADTDIIYFVLSVAELLKLNQDKLTVKLFGNVNANGSLTGLMKKYISQVELMKRPEQYSYPASFREFQDQQHYLQICSLLCAS